MNIETVNELIHTLESAGELSIKETKVMALVKAFKQLAAENVGLKAFITDNCWIYDIRVEQYRDAVGYVPEATATDRIYAGIKADGVEKLTDRLQKHLDEGDFSANEVGVIAGAIHCGREMAQQLREGAK